MEARHGVLGRVWITDRGMASTANLAWLRETGRRYIIGAPKSELKKFSAERPADLASARGPRSSSHPGLLSRLRPVEVPRDVAEPRRSRQLAAHSPRRARPHSVAR